MNTPHTIIGKQVLESSGTSPRPRGSGMASVATDISRAGTDTLVFPKNDDDNECKVPPQAYNTYATGIVMPYTAYLVKNG